MFYIFFLPNHSLFLYGLLLSLRCFYLLVNYYFKASLKLKVIFLRGQIDSKHRAWATLNWTPHLLYEQDKVHFHAYTVSHFWGQLHPSIDPKGKVSAIVTPTPLSWWLPEKARSMLTSFVYIVYRFATTNVNQRLYSNCVHIVSILLLSSWPR